MLRLRPDPEVTPHQLERGKQRLVRDAAWASLSGALSGGVILVAFALSLGASPLVIGLLAAVPFFAPLHGAPVDCSRWSARGLKNLLVEAGFQEERVQSFQWGNRHVAQRNLEVPWPPALRDDDDLTNDPDFPVVAWAMAQKD